MDQSLYTIQSSATAIEAAEKIQRNHLRAVIVMAGEKAVGVCSQGDIMRLLLRGGSVHTVIEKIIQHPFLFLREKNWEEAYALIVKHGITLIPVLDQEFHLIDVITLAMVLERMQIKTA